MKIERLRTNHLENPVGYDFGTLTVSYTVSEARGRRQQSARIRVATNAAMEQPIYDSGAREDICSTGFELPITAEPETIYYWTVEVTDETGDVGVSDTAWFETGKAGAWTADWISPKAPKEQQVVLYRKVQIDKPVAKVRAYMTGLGLYEFYVDGTKQGEECLLPGFTNYDAWIQYQTFAVDLSEGEHSLEIMLGDGWYKGWYGLKQTSENYGDRLAAIAEIKVWYADGTSEVIRTDPTWKARPSKVCYSGIYPGEVVDMTLDDSTVFETEVIDPGKERLSERLSAPITVHEKITPIEVIHTPAGETVLDMGQNMVGWLTFRTDAPAGTKLHFSFGEILQEGNFYRDNLRSAKAEFTYISDGIEREVRQHFTFYGFRFVKVEGWPGEVKKEQFTGWVIHSQMDEIGSIETADPLVNQLIHNAKWGMKGNFVDVPTDCPQRDERYGWTGDAQIFSGTACFFMDTYAFYTKYGKDLYSEQVKLHGSVPDVVPVANCSGDATTAWGDAATVIPWNVYLHYGDPSILRRQYDSMKGWVDYMNREDEASGGKRLWTTGRHYGDWVALDGNYPGGVYGETDPHLIASAYYYYSTCIVAKSAKVLGEAADEAYYEQLAKEIREGFIREYFTPNGRLSVDTMTAYVLALYMGLTPDNAYENVRKGLLRKLKRNRYHLETGFVGTPYLCRMLSEHGMNDLAYHLLLEKGYPGWLYEVLMGATTIWERWNSVEEDGRMSGTEMNSLNHYAYGSIVEWMYRNMVGLQPSEAAPGYKHFTIAPKPDYRIPVAKAALQSASGLIKAGWEIKEGKLSFDITVPFDAVARLILPDAPIDQLLGQKTEGMTDVREAGRDVTATLEAGTYHFSYTPTVPYRKIYSIDSPFEELAANPKTAEILKQYYPPFNVRIPFEKELYTLEEMAHGPFTGVDEETLCEIDRQLRAVE